MENPKRQAFLDACAPWTKIGLTDLFIRGYDDRQCGRPRAFDGATVASDAYRAGWNAYETKRHATTKGPAQ